MMGSVWDVLTIARMHKWGRSVVHRFIGVLETLGVANKGTQKMADSLAVAAECLVAGGKEKLFTPMYLIVARKPADAKS